MSAALCLAALAAAGYLLGSVPFGYLVGRWRGVDVLAHGSKNIGATNVGRVLGPRWGVLVFLLDAAKGALPALAALAVASAVGAAPPKALGVGAGVAAFLGHLFPLYLGFKGGKGVATGAGVVAVLLPWETLAALLLWLVVTVTTRYVSLASLLAALLLCGLRLAGTPAGPWSESEWVLTAFCLVAGGLVVYRHRANLRRLLTGTENRLKDSPAMLTLSRALHLLAVGLWFGAAVFFTLAGVLLFDTFDRLSARPANERPLWFPRPPEFEGDWKGEKLTGPRAREQGSRAAGYAVTPLFPWYYGLQTGCALVAAATALSWAVQRGGALNKVRAAVLLAALATVGVGWWLERTVEGLRGPRNDRTDEVLRSQDPTPEMVRAAEEARGRFGMWHGFSLLQNFLTLALVTLAVLLAAQLPTTPAATPAAEAPKPRHEPGRMSVGEPGAPAAEGGAPAREVLSGG
jgi:acyl phosphate:glycerol-3-phosphate acyltransferase